MSDWKEIESAPRDGSTFLGTWKSVFLNEWFMQPMKFKDGVFVVTWDHDVGEATHWQEMPKPPNDC